MWKTASENFSILYYTILLVLLQCECVCALRPRGAVGVCDLLELWRCWSICFILLLQCLPICWEGKCEFCLIGFKWKRLYFQAALVNFHTSTQRNTRSCDEQRKRRRSAPKGELLTIPKHECTIMDFCQHPVLDIFKYTLAEIKLLVEINCDCLYVELGGSTLTC